MKFLQSTLNLLLCLFACLTAISQTNSVPFSNTSEFYLHGESALIGNTILSQHKTKALNKPNQLNDNTKMVYVDVDKDSKTFSSSEATLTLPEGIEHITYAALYWGATFPFKKGLRKVENKTYVFKSKGKREAQTNQIKIKIGYLDYKELTGDYVYNANKAKAHKNTQP